MSDYMDYYIEILKHNEISTAILVTMVALLYLVIAYYKKIIFKGWASIIGKLFSLKLFSLIIILIIVIWMNLNYSDVKNDAYYTSINSDLRVYFDELMKMKPEFTTKIEEVEGKQIFSGSYEISSKAKVNLHPVKTKFKAIAITSDTINNKVYLEERLNKELQKHGKYSKDPDSIDYIICYFQKWNRNHYIGDGGMATCETENAFIQIVDLKRHEVVDTVKIEIDRNPEQLTVETNQFGFGSKEITLTSEELYYYIENRKKITAEKGNNN